MGLQGGRVTTKAPRYAVYFTPAQSLALNSFGAAVLGYDADTGETTTATAARRKRM
jgi:hypothetical protein